MSTNSEKTVLAALISDLKEINRRGITLTHSGIITVLENSLENERQQIIDAFNEGVKYGNSDLQTFDHPASLYYGFTFKNE